MPAPRVRDASRSWMRPPSSAPSRASPTRSWSGTGRRPALVGIRSRGVPLARRLAAKLESLDGKAVPTGVLDINLYRDDLSRIGDHPVLRRTEIPFEVDDSVLVLVDDVLFTGRTIRAALDGSWTWGGRA